MPQLSSLFERPSMKGKPASAGWYNSVAFEKAAHKQAFMPKALTAMLFPTRSRRKQSKRLKPTSAKSISLSTASHLLGAQIPKPAKTYKSVLKPIGESFTNRTLDTDKDLVTEVTIEPAEGDDVADTVNVMGGQDWELWMDALDEAGVLAPSAKSVAYSYIGPEITWPVYTNGNYRPSQEGRRARCCRDYRN